MGQGVITKKTAGKISCGFLSSTHIMYLNKNSSGDIIPSEGMMPLSRGIYG
jgi:hypothetical protein